MSRRGHGEGSIFKRSDGRWEAQMTVEGSGAGSIGNPGNGGGPKKRKSFYGKTRAEVAHKLATALREQELGLPIAREDQTVAQFVTSWLESVAPPVLKARTHQRYRELLTLHVVPTLGTVRLARLSPQQVQDLYSQKLAAGLASTTVNHLHMVLHRMLDRAMRLELVARNVSERVDAPPMRTKAIHPLSRADVQRLLTAAAERNDRLQALYVLAVTTGMRQGELLALRWSDVDLAHSTRPSLRVQQTVQRVNGAFVLSSPKTPKSRRRIALTQAALSALVAHRARQVCERARAGAAWQEHDLVFPTEVGTLLAADTVRYQFWAALRAGGLQKVRFHDLRHTCATLLLGQHVNPKIVSEMLGHATVAITLDIYSHVLPDMQQDAAAVLDALLAD